MRYFLRKYREKINQFKPVQLCFDDDYDDNDNESKSSSSLESLTIIPENAINLIKSPKQQQIITRSKTRQSQQLILQSSSSSSSKTQTPTIPSKTLITKNNNNKLNSYQNTPKITTTTTTTINQRTNIPTRTPATIATTTTTVINNKRILNNGTTTNPINNNNNNNNNKLVKQKQIQIDESTTEEDDDDNDEEMIINNDEPTLIQTTPKLVQSLNYTSNSDNDDDNHHKKSTSSYLNNQQLTNGTTPPHKKFRKLRLFDTPHTPKTLFKKSSFNFNDDDDDDDNDDKKDNIKQVSPVTCRINSNNKVLIRDKSPLSCHYSADECFKKTTIPTIPSTTTTLIRTRRTITTGSANLNIQPRSRLFGTTTAINAADESIVPSLSTEKLVVIGRSPSPYQHKHNLNQPQANINPFTPNNSTNQNTIRPLNNNNNNNQVAINSTQSILLQSSKLTSLRKRERSSLMDNNDDINDYDQQNNNNNNNNNDDIDDNLPKNKRLALRQCAVSRYHEEFHEVCKLGSGEFGDVFKCINRLDGCTYAIKRSKKPIAGSALEISAWKEVCAHAVLVKHNHIVQYYSAWAEDDRMLIQNEYCNGGSLAEYLEQNKLNGQIMNEIELKTIILHIARGLSYMHSLKLVHLDIKPGNIFMCRNTNYRMLRNYNNNNQATCSIESGIESEEHDNELNEYNDNDDDNYERIIYKIGDLGHVTSTLDSSSSSSTTTTSSSSSSTSSSTSNILNVEEGDCRYLPNEILQEQYTHLTKADIFALSLTVYVCGSNDDLPKNGHEWHWIRRGNLKDLPQCNDRFKKLLLQMINENPILRPSATTLIHHPCICPDASKNKAQLLKELNQEKFKNELLQRKVREYEQQIKEIPTPNTTPIISNNIKSTSSSSSSKFVRSISCNLLS